MKTLHILITFTIISLHSSILPSQSFKSTKDPLFKGTLPQNNPYGIIKQSKSSELGLKQKNFKNRNNHSSIGLKTQWFDLSNEEQNTKKEGSDFSFSGNMEPINHLPIKHQFDIMLAELSQPYNEISQYNKAHHRDFNFQYKEKPLLRETTVKFVVSASNSPSIDSKAKTESQQNIKQTQVRLDKNNKSSAKKINSNKENLNPKKFNPTLKTIKEVPDTLLKKALPKENPDNVTKQDQDKDMPQHDPDFSFLGNMEPINLIRMKNQNGEIIQENFDIMLAELTRPDDAVSKYNEGHALNQTYRKDPNFRFKKNILLPETIIKLAAIASNSAKIDSKVKTESQKNIKPTQVKLDNNNKLSDKKISS